MSNIAKAEKEPLSVKAAVEAPEFKRELARIVGDAIGADRVARMVVTSIARTPGLAECTPKSVLSAVYQAVQLGLTLDGRHAHLVPFRDGDKKVCTLVPDYKGLIQLALKSKIVTAITLETVCENDDFQWDRGVITHHKVDWRNPRGEAYAWYAIAKMSSGGEACVVLPRQEVDAIRARAKKGPKQSPWDTDFNEMAKKTAFKRLAKVLPLTPEFAEAERMESEEAAKLERERLAREAEARRIEAEARAEAERKAREAAEADRRAQQTGELSLDAAAANAQAEAEAAAKAAADAAAQAAAAASAPVVVPVTVVAPPPPKLAGLRQREVWVFDVTDAQALAKARPDLVVITPKTRDITAALDRGETIPGIAARKEARP